MGPKKPSRGAAADSGLGPQALFQRAIAHYEAGRYREARKALAPLLSLPDREGFVTLLNGLIESALGEWKSAEKWLRAGVKLLPQRFEGWMGLGNVLRMQGSAEDAVESYRRALQIQPDSADAWSNLAIANADMRRDYDAIAAFDRAIELQPGFTGAIRGKAEALVRVGRFEEATSVYEQLMSASPGDPGLALDYAEVLERANRTEAARQALPDADRLRTPKQIATCEVIRARLIARDGRVEEALEILRSVRRKTREDWVLFTEGNLLDRLGRTGEAMEAFRRANASRSRLWSFRRLRDQKLLPYLDDKLEQGIERAPARHREQTGQEDEQPVFIVGLPRSGTTLLDRMLAAHPGIQVLEEPESLRIAEAAIAAGEGVDAARARYWEFIEATIGLERGKVIVDKNPLHAMHLDHLPALFPDARVIYALRHPYDAALSCYMQDFAPNPATIHFVELDSTGALCARLLQMMQQFEAACPDRVVRVRYEDLVTGDLRQHLEPLLNAIGLSWHADIEDFAVKASQAGLIRTASYEQVTRGLYKTAIERWQRYEEWIEPFHRELGPMLEYWGYGE